jgi:uncharacterized membrane protein YgdD (TMEM256/DUF423 family)
MGQAMTPVARAAALAGAASGLLAVMLAAAGAHLVPASEPGLRSFWATALQMQLFHSLALLALAALADRCRPQWAGLAALAFIAGIVLFCGSLYLRALGLDVLPGPVTPAGGLLLMCGWLLAIATFARR